MNILLFPLQQWDVGWRAIPRPFYNNLHPNLLCTKKTFTQRAIYNPSWHTGTICVYVRSFWKGGVSNWPFKGRTPFNSQVRHIRCINPRIKFLWIMKPFNKILFVSTVPPSLYDFLNLPEIIRFYIYLLKFRLIESSFHPLILIVE